MEGFLRIGLGNEPQDLTGGLEAIGRVLRTLGTPPGF
jgi:hypothetical protein